MLKQARKDKNLTQKQLSKIANISQSYISRLEQDIFINSPTIRQIISLSKALDISAYKLSNYFIDKENAYNKKR
ncbi:TPA: helix-turn-helix transcriptional regulator [Clostridioides difficile]|uniref:helix-turn-helix domain-containing protein n=1 Tax=Clostridioides difficile TaxID=1496 RepID=UPI000D1DB2CC|nr:helix-turn-helix transcriptional regulator [Clostridioides difficile]EKS6772521.1 helix-turn-helix transcriptional regulator [Clostridioides difficile]EKS6824024.1 helix-turn-helix transcriptional regulator [Clostridioides difficile]MBY2757212.1 helix-turn-helix transcriptional regulator [Clostridioides difficile]MDE3598296.1 helix-turn-helix transcriptional regulator [Clostridioides difficile]MDE3668861.1 helix-turn-helix transcriptional regulator [Clostridioides difficile]